MSRDVECIVVGLGGLGSAAAYWLSKRTDVLGLERFELGHERGASEDHSRIIRLSYHTPWYVALAREAYATWREVEAESGEQLIVTTGGLDLGPRDAAISIEDYAKSMRASDVPFDELDAGEIMARWPQWHLDEDVHGLFQEDAGMVAATAANEAHRRLAREHGARLQDRTPVTAIDPAGNEVAVETADGTYRCATVVIAADAWTNRLLGPLGRELPLTVTKEQVTYFEANDPQEFRPERFPIWIWMDDPSFYGVPTLGGPGPKAGRDRGGPIVDDPDVRTFDPDPAAAQILRRFMTAHLPEAAGPELLTKTCLYTLTPDRDFVIDALPEHPSVVVALGAAHAFKFASLIGRTLAELALDGDASVDVEPFRIDRPLLAIDDPPTNWMV